MTISRDEFEALYRANAADILGYLRRRSAGDEAPDLLAETFLIAWRRRNDLPEAAGRRAWLFGTARRLRLASLREPTTAQLAEPVVRPTLPPSANPALGRAVAEALGRLSESDRELLTLTIWEGLQPAEAAKVVGIQPTAARVRLHRIRRRLAGDPALCGYLAAEPTPIQPTPSSGTLGAFLG